MVDLNSPKDIHEMWWIIGLWIKKKKRHILLEEKRLVWETLFTFVELEKLLPSQHLDGAVMHLFTTITRGSYHYFTKPQCPSLQLQCTEECLNDHVGIYKKQPMLPKETPKFKIYEVLYSQSFKVNLIHFLWIFFHSSVSNEVNPWLLFIHQYTMGLI